MVVSFNYDASGKGIDSRVILLLPIPASVQHGSSPCRRTPVELQLIELNPAEARRLFVILHSFRQVD